MSLHVSLLRPVTSDPMHGQRAPPPPPVVVDDEEEYLVERILDNHVRRR
jgi:hypothetical protein